jgi:hypothetical protein
MAQAAGGKAPKSQKLEQILAEPIALNPIRVSS